MAEAIKHPLQESLSLEQPSLEQLRDIHFPDPIGFWPPALGWWLLGALFLLGLCLLFFFLHKRSKRKFLREALNNIGYMKSQNDISLGDLNALMKQVAIKIYGRKNVSSLHSDLWLHFLNEKAGEEIFTEKESALLYQSQPNPRQVKAYATNCEAWFQSQYSRI